MAHERFDPHRVDLETILHRLKLLDRKVRRRMGEVLYRIDRRRREGAGDASEREEPAEAAA